MLQIDPAAVMENSRKLFPLIRAVGRKGIDLSKTVCETDFSPIHDQQQHLGCWAEHFKEQVIRSPVPVFSVAIPSRMLWTVSVDTPSGLDIREKIQVLGAHKSPIFAALFPSL